MTKKLYTDGELRQQYLKYKSIHILAKKYNCSSSKIYSDLKKNKISTAKIYKVPYNLNLSMSQNEFILGSMLGDGHIANRKVNTYYVLSQRKREYVCFVKKILNKFVINIHRCNNIYQLRTCFHPEFKKLRNFCYYRRKKKISLDWLNSLTDFSLAVWIMEDGSLHKKSKNYCLATCSFSKKEHRLIKKWFKEKYNIDAKIIRNSYNNHTTIKFRKEASIKLSKIIEPYIIPCMKYKIIQTR